MNRVKHVGLMAAYNQWMNESMYSAAAQLPAGELVADKQAFFGSILGTLNHIAVGDTIWLKRFATHPSRFAVLQQLETPEPGALNQLLFPDFESLHRYRMALDAAICQWAATLTEADLDVVLAYKNRQGVAANKSFYGLLMHFFNHQTHHRGQVSTLLFQSGVDVGVTDLVSMIPNG
ncbi:MAG: DinB family protein [Betaproteobacteria bacterium]|nr:DinB family protein [Betaproteobacteria bacterium]